MLILMLRPIPHKEGVASEVPNSQHSKDVRGESPVFQTLGKFKFS